MLSRRCIGYSDISTCTFSNYQNLTVSNTISECSQPLSTGSKEVEEYTEIRDLIEKIRVLQTGKLIHRFR